MKKVLTLVLLGALMAALHLACNSEEQLTYARYYSNGKKLYESRCANCHNADGTGLAALIPPLTDTLYLRENRSKLACFIRQGLHDTISVAGRTYSGAMPATPGMADIDAAAIITYVTNSFGNKQGLYDVSEASVHAKQCEVHEHRH
jgi:mono/diheme cytochrome c family protein